MVRKLLAVMVAATLMAGSAWAAEIIDVGGADNTELHAASVAIVDGAAVATTTANNAIAIGSSLGSGRSVGTITGNGTGDIFIGTLDGTQGFTTPSGKPGPKQFTLTATSIATVTGDLDVTRLATNGITALTVNGNVSVLATGTLDLTGAGVADASRLTFTQTAGKMNVVGGAATFTNANVNIKGGSVASGDHSVYGAELDIIGSTYTDGGDVSIATDSDWGVTGAPANKAIVSIAGNVLITDDADLAITGKSSAELGSFSWTATTNAAFVDVTEGSSLVVNNDMEIDTTAHELKIGTADTTATGKSSAEFMGKLTFVGDGTKTGLVGNDGALLKVETLVIGKEDGTSTAGVEATELDVTVRGLTTIHAVASLLVDGTADKYEGGIVVTGALIGDTNANTTINTGENWVTLQDGGLIGTDNADNTKTFKIDGAGVQVKNTPDGARTDVATIEAGTTGGNITITNALVVEGDLDLASTVGGSDTKITVGTYTQKSGDVEEAVAGVNFTVLGDASIEEGYFEVTSNNAALGTTTFTQGVTVDSGATLKGATATGGVEHITLGDGKAVTLAGGTLEDLTLDAATPAGKVNIIVTKAGSTIDTVVAATTDLNIRQAGGYDFGTALTTNATQVNSVTITEGEVAIGALTTAKNFRVEKDAILTANTAAAAAISNGAGTADEFIAAAGSNINAIRNSLAINTFETTTLDGNMLLGNGTGINVNNAANTKVTVGPNAKFILTPDAVRNAAAVADGAGAAVVLTATNGTLTNTAPIAYNNALGQFVFDRDDPTVVNANDQIFLAYKEGVTQGSYEPADIAQMGTNLDVAWAEFGANRAIDGSIVQNVYDFIYADGAAGNLAGTFEWNSEYSPSENAFGAKNIFRELLYATAITDTTRVSEGTFKSVYGNGDVSDMLNAGMGEVRGVTSAIGTRNVQLRSQMAGAGDVRYEYANPTLLLNNDYANRIWAGYLGQWEKADSKNGVSGYDYDSHGFIIGYDRLVGCNFAFGGAFAYTRGDYEDKAADSSSSKVDNYSINGYMTYSALNGVFASLFGGYMYQENDLSATYRTTSRKADFDTDFWNIGTQLGYDFQPADGFVLTPSIGLQYIHGRTDSFTSALNGSAGTYGWGAVNGTDADAFMLPIELAARYTIDFSNCSRLGLEANIGYAYNFSDKGGAADMTVIGGLNNGNAISFAGREREQSRHQFNAGAGLRYTFNRFDIGVKYDYYLREDAHAHRVMGSVGVSF